MIKTIKQRACRPCISSLKETTSKPCWWVRSFSNCCYWINQKLFYILFPWRHFFEGSPYNRYNFFFLSICGTNLQIMAMVRRFIGWWQRKYWSGLVSKVWMGSILTTRWGGSRVEKENDGHNMKKVVVAILKARHKGTLLEPCFFKGN